MTYPAPLPHFGSLFGWTYAGPTYSAELWPAPLPSLSSFFRQIDLAADPRFIVTAVGRSYTQTAASRRDVICA
jgi:hypothetical protein